MFLKPSVSNLDFQSFYPRDQVEPKLRRLVKDLKVLVWINISLPPQTQYIFYLQSKCGNIFFLLVKLEFLVWKIPIESVSDSFKGKKEKKGECGTIAFEIQLLWTSDQTNFGRHKPRKSDPSESTLSPTMREHTRIIYQVKYFQQLKNHYFGFFIAKIIRFGSLKKACFDIFENNTIFHSAIMCHLREMSAGKQEGK